MAKSLASPSPVLSSGFSKVSPDGAAMSLQGAVAKSAFLAAIVMLTAVFSYVSNIPSGLITGSLIAGIVLAIVITLRPHRAPYLAPVYAVIEGVALGGISLWYSKTYGGDIIINALGLTAGVFMALLFLYASRLIKVTQNFMLAVYASVLGIMIYYGASILASFFGATLPLISSASPLGILFSVFVVGVASASLVMDFDHIEKGAELGYPKYMEWYSAFGLLVTIIWLYLEILRLLAKLNRRN